MPRPPRPDDLFALRVPVEVAISPDGRNVAFTVKSVAPGKDGYRTAIWIAPADGSDPARQLTVGAGSDHGPRWSPDGRMLAFLSDRAAVLQAGGAGPKPGKADAPERGRSQAWLLPFADGGEARQLSDLPEDVEELAWSPDGSRICAVSCATRATRRTAPRREPDAPPESDIRLIDRLQYQFNGAGFVDDRWQNLWLLDLAGGEARRLTGGRSHDRRPAWSPDGRRIAFVSDRHRNADLSWRTDVYLVELRGGAVRRLTSGGGDQEWGAPAWSPDGAWIAAPGSRDWERGRIPQGGAWRIRVRDGRAENLIADADLDVASGMNSDLFGGGEPRVAWYGDDGRWLVFPAAVEGSLELWRVAADGSAPPERLTEGRHHLGRQDVVSVARRGGRLAAVRAAPTQAPDIVVADLPAGRLGGASLALRQVSDLMGEAWGDVVLVAPEERWHDVDGRRVQGWFYAAPGSSRRNPAPAVVEIHGGPATLYGWSLMWEWQCLAASGISVYACNPRGSQGYGDDFLSANFGDWGEGPMRDVTSGIDALVADGRVDPDRLGVTGGSYGGYLTSWIVGHTDRFRAAVTCRSVNDMTSQMLSGDAGGPTFGRLTYGVSPWEDWDLYRRHSPLTHATNVTTPLLIQHAEKDLRCTITQAEELFAVLRSLRRTVRLMRVPDESHELTRSGTPFRRVDNLRIIRDWFVHFLVEGRSGLPPARTAPGRSG